jgi:signal peptidase I
MTEKGKKPKRISGFRLFMTTLILLVLMITWALFMAGSLRAMEVSRSSMSPTLLDEDRLLVRDIETKDLKRGVIITLLSPDDSGADLVKRLVALPGDTVQYKNGIFLVNDTPFPPPGDPTFHAEDKTTEPVTLSDDEYFVLGDNREKSLDSEEFGPVLRKDLNGLVLFRYSPLKRMKSF